MRFNQTFTPLAVALSVNPVAHAAETYRVDPAHTSITFSVSHLGINTVKGQFKEFAGVIVLNEGTMTEASATIQVTSVDTGVPQRDDHLRTADFFDVGRYPTITFKAKRIKKQLVFTRHQLPDGRITIVADFTMRGVTKELQL